MYTGFFDRQNTIDYADTYTETPERDWVASKNLNTGYYWINDFSPCKDYTFIPDYSSIDEVSIM